MTKRKLSRQQAWRVGKIQRERARRASKRDVQVLDALSAGDLGPEQEGTIVAHYGAQLTVESVLGTMQRCHLRANLEGLVTGDRVVWRAGEPTGVVVAQQERFNALSRPDPQGKLKPVAANIDQMLVVIAPYPEPHANLLDRYLVAAETMEIEPVILLNKTDLLTTDSRLAARVNAMLANYPKLGYPLLHTSTKTGEQSELRATLQGCTSVIVGQSGVGKSSLVNALLPGAGMRVGDLSGTKRKGTHTTTTAQLMHLSCGGSLIDSPGIREFALWHMTKEEVAQGFREFRPYLGSCKFRDCQHAQEPGCALLAAVDAGDVSEERLHSYQRIVGSLEHF
ncbi:MAG: small ribosomal subunit biogenesis GTPase RsgA [Halioglobus sp.]|nr:small ribosomal subunit biogenesis GTPase RsgA [Halioglobus sp.]